MAKKRYRVRNWGQYNQALVKRGSVSFWLDEEAIQRWHDIPSGRRGRPCVYSEWAIVIALTLRAIFRLPLRATEGFMRDLIKRFNLPLSVPDYTTLCKRAKSVSVSCPRHGVSGQALHIVCDSTGLKVFGEGEWKVRQHRDSKRRTWRKLHLALDVESQHIVSAMLTTNDVHDSEVLDDLLENAAVPLAKLSADGAYDTQAIHSSLAQRGIRSTIPPRKNSVLSHRPEQAPRDDAIRRVKRLGLRLWKKISGYHQRSLAETAMFRLKTLFGDRLRSRTFHNQTTEAFIRCRTLNLMTQLGMPDSYPI